MEIEYWKKGNVLVLAEIHENGLIKVGGNIWHDYLSFSIEMERYGYQKLGE